MSRHCIARRAATVALLLVTGPMLQAKPIAFANGTSVMAEYGGNTMREAQVFYAPRFDLSLGFGYLRLASDADGRQRDIGYARVNFLPRRWNLESAQANVFVGRARQRHAERAPRLDPHRERRGAARLRNAPRLRLGENRPAALRGLFAPHRHRAARPGTVCARLRHARHLAAGPGAALRRQPARRHGRRAAASTVQGQQVAGGRRHGRWRAPGDVHGQLLGVLHMFRKFSLSALALLGAGLAAGRHHRDEGQRAGLRIVRRASRRPCAGTRRRRTSSSAWRTVWSPWRPATARTSPTAN